MARTIVEDVRKPQIAGSFTAGYRPPQTGPDALIEREQLVVFPDKVLLIGTGGGAFIEISFGGGGAAPTPYAITAAASFTASHGRSYAPETWILDVTGEEVEADVFHSPGAVTVTFAQPFTGTLMLR